MVFTQVSAFQNATLTDQEFPGPVVRLAPGRYSINDKSAIKPIYGHGSKFTKSWFYHPFGVTDENSTNMFAELDNARHAANRRKIASMYSMTTMVSYEKYVDNCNKTLLSNLAMFAEKRQPFDVPTWMQFYGTIHADSMASLPTCC